MVTSCKKMGVITTKEQLDFFKQKPLKEQQQCLSELREESIEGKHRYNNALENRSILATAFYKNFFSNENFDESFFGGDKNVNSPNQYVASFNTAFEKLADEKLHSGQRIDKEFNQQVKKAIKIEGIDTEYEIDNKNGINIGNNEREYLKYDPGYCTIYETVLEAEGCNQSGKKI